MTIKKLCKKYTECKECPFNNICNLSVVIWCYIFKNDENNIAITNSIIETAKALQEEDNDDKIDL